MLSSAHAPEMHAVVTELISRIVSMAAPAPGAGVNDGPGAPTSPTSNRFARELAARESVATLVGFVVQDFRPAAACEGDDLTVDDLPEYGPALPNMQSATSSVVSSIAVLVELIRKNNSDYFEPYLFHTLRNRLIQVQQQSAGQTEDNRQALEDAMREMVDRMGVVHLGPVLDVVCEHMDKIQSFLTKPRSSVRAACTMSLFSLINEADWPCVYNCWRNTAADDGAIPDLRALCGATALLEHGASESAG
jgi:serine/threonine-protein phosphatase 6 regulatory subunit 3